MKLHVLDREWDLSSPIPDGFNATRFDDSSDPYGELLVGWYPSVTQKLAIASEFSGSLGYIQSAPMFWFKTDEDCWSDGDEDGTLTPVNSRMQRVPLNSVMCETCYLRYGWYRTFQKGWLCANEGDHVPMEAVRYV